MNKVLKERSADIAAAMRGLCDAVGKLSLVRDDLNIAMKTAPHGSLEEIMSYKITVAVERLTHAAAAIPDECWAVMLMDKAVGGHEVHQRVETLLKNTMIVNKVARSQAA
jgi:hypothetical protein